MKVFNLKKIFLSSIMFLSVLSCNNIFAMKKYVPNYFRAQNVDGTNVQIDKIQKVSDAFAESTIQNLLKLPSSVLSGDIRSYLIENKRNFKDGLSSIFKDSLLEQHPTVITDLSNRDPEVAEILSSSFVDKILPALCEVIQSDCPDLRLLDDINHDAFAVRFKKIILESFGKMAKSSWGFNKIMQKASSGAKFTANAALFASMLFGVFIVYESFALMNKGYYKEGAALISAIGILYVVLYKLQTCFSGVVYPVFRQGQQVYNDGHDLVYGPERKPEVEEVLRRIAREEARRR